MPSTRWGTATQAVTGRRRFSDQRNPATFRNNFHACSRFQPQEIFRPSGGNVVASAWERDEREININKLVFRNFVSLTCADLACESRWKSMGYGPKVNCFCSPGRQIPYVRQYQRITDTRVWHVVSCGDPFWAHHVAVLLERESFGSSRPQLLAPPACAMMSGATGELLPEQTRDEPNRLWISINFDYVKA